MYVPFAEVSFCDVADPDGFSQVLVIPVVRDQLVSTLPVSFNVEPLSGGGVPYPEDQAMWQAVPRRDARELRACPPSGADGAAVLADQRARWASTGTQTYEFVLFWGVSSAAFGYHRMTVVDGTPAMLEPLDLSLLRGLSDDEQQAALVAKERAGVEAALAPGIVDWVADLRAVVGDDATIAQRHAVVTVSEPVIDGSVAEITVELWCGMNCGGRSRTSSNDRPMAFGVSSGAPADGRRDRISLAR